MKPVLHQFAFSHFNEKARWALDWKQLPHLRQTYLPGPHRAAIQKISGQAQTPVLQIEDHYIAGSAALIDELERRYPQPALYPADPDARQRALQWQAEYDREVGPAVRTVFFNALIDHGTYLGNMFGKDKSTLKRLAYRALYPVAKPMIAKANGVNPDNVSRCRDIVATRLDQVVEQTAASGYVVGDHFSIADLTTAALLAPIAAVDHPDMARPQPLPDEVQALIDHYRDHAAVAWVKQMYAQHRPLSAP